MPLTWWASKSRSVLGLLCLYLNFPSHFQTTWICYALCRAFSHRLPMLFLHLFSFWGLHIFVCHILIDFQSPLVCVLGTSGHAGNPGWRVVTGQCDLWASGEGWVSESEWRLTGMVEGCSGKSQFSSMSLWLPLCSLLLVPKETIPRFSFLFS